ncbi:hypothetical protein ACTFIT_000330 [Dictyostelium discoideum]
MNVVILNKVDSDLSSTSDNPTPSSPSKDENSNETKSGLLAGLFWRKKPKTKEINLDDFYYNEELGKWVERGKESTPPLPPTKSYSSSHTDGMITPPPFGGGGGNASPPSVLSSSPSTRLPIDSGGAPSSDPSQPPRGPNTRRKPRYVDTLNQTVYTGGVNNSSSQSLPPKPPTSTFTPFMPAFDPSAAIIEQQQQQKQQQQQQQQQQLGDLGFQSRV